MALFFFGSATSHRAQSFRGLDAPQGGFLYFVNTTSDTVVVGACENGNAGCSLRAAISAADNHPGADGIEIDIPTSDPNYNGIFWTIHLSSALPNLTESVGITGPGAAKLVVRRNTGGNYRIFNVTTAAVVTLTGMTIREGSASSGSGGGILNSNASGTLNLTNCIITTNSAFNGHGGGIANSGTLNATNCIVSNNSCGAFTASNSGGGIYSTGTLTLINCTLSGNSSTFEGGGLFSSAATVVISSCIFGGNIVHLVVSGGGDAHGGGLFVGANATIKNCTVNDNSASGTNGKMGSGGDGLGGGIYLNGGTVDIINCSIANNSANREVIAIANGGGIFNQGATANITNSTIWNNVAADNGGGIYNNSTLNVTNCTAGNNTARTGGGIFNNFGHTANIKSSLIASNTGTTASPDLAGGTFTSQGFNLVGKNDGAASSFPAGNPNGNNDIVGTSASPIDPKLDPNGLQNNGGSTPTVALQTDSPAIDKGTSNGSTGHLTTDQRGIGYVRTIDNPGVPNAMGGDGTDIGAFEFGANIPTVSRKTHGAAGTFDVDVAVGSNSGIECRSGGANGDHQLVLAFPSSVTVTGMPQAQVTSGTGQIGTGGVPNGGTVTVSGSSVTVPLTNVANAQAIAVTLFSVNNGMNSNNVTIPMRVLLGDTTANASVNASDVSQTKGQLGQTVTNSNFRTDVNANGTLNASDVAIVKSQVGTSIP